MAKYVYPAIFTKEEQGYSINFPDLENCYTQGDDLSDGLEMAEDVLALVLYGYETKGKTIPAPSSFSDFQLAADEFVNFIQCDTMEYRRMYSGKAVKKTLTIPEWLNEEATAVNVNFSQVLQEALIAKLQNRG